MQRKVWEKVGGNREKGSRRYPGGTEKDQLPTRSGKQCRKDSDELSSAVDYFTPIHLPGQQVCCCCCCQVTSVVSDSVRPHRRQPTRLPRPWDSPGKNTGGGCQFLLRCMKVKSEREVAQSCTTLRDPVNCSLPGSPIHGIFQARVLEWGAIAFSRTTGLEFYNHEP